jgi:hypothetical protein
MGTEWIKLYDQESQEARSSWIRSVGWNNGDLILRIYDEDPEDPQTVRYENLDRKLFEKIKNSYHSGDSVGSIINEEVIRNKDVEPAHKM